MTTNEKPGTPPGPEELFDAALAQRRKQIYPIEQPKPAEDVPMLALMADQRAHQRTNEQLCRIYKHVLNAEGLASAFRSDYYNNVEAARQDRLWRDKLTGVLVVGAAFTCLVLWLLLGA